MTEIRKSSIALLLFITACSNTPNVPTDVTKPDTDTKDKKETTLEKKTEKKRHLCRNKKREKNHKNTNSHCHKIHTR